MLSLTCPWLERELETVCLMKGVSWARMRATRSPLLALEVSVVTTRCTAGVMRRTTLLSTLEVTVRLTEGLERTTTKLGCTLLSSVYPMGPAR